MENFRCDVEGCLRQSPCEECSLYGVYSSQPPSAEAIRDVARDALPKLSDEIKHNIVFRGTMSLDGRYLRVVLDEEYVDPVTGYSWPIENEFYMNGGTIYRLAEKKNARELYFVRYDGANSILHDVSDNKFTYIHDFTRNYGSSQPAARGLSRDGSGVRIVPLPSSERATDGEKDSWVYRDEAGMRADEPRMSDDGLPKAESIFDPKVFGGYVSADAKELIRLRKENEDLASKTNLQERAIIAWRKRCGEYQKENEGLRELLFLEDKLSEKYDDENYTQEDQIMFPRISELRSLLSLDGSVDQPASREAIRDQDSTATHGGNRVFKCSKCGCLLQTDSLIPGVCVQSFITRNSGICGGEYVLQI